MNAFCLGFGFFWGRPYERAQRFSGMRAFQFCLSGNRTKYFWRTSETNFLGIFFPFLIGYLRFIVGDVTGDATFKNSR